MTGRFGNDQTGYAALREHVAAWLKREWAIDGSSVG
jgi:hypothetical protein